MFTKKKVGRVTLKYIFVQYCISASPKKCGYMHVDSVQTGRLLQARSSGFQVEWVPLNHSVLYIKVRFFVF